MINSIKDYTVLNNGEKMPWLGFGVYQANDGFEVENAVNCALEAGYRSIDTATVYGNEVGVGRAIRESGVPREEVFLSTKVWNEDQRQKRTLTAFHESLDRLRLDYVDLYLVHWPVEGFYLETWKIMEGIYLSGRAKAIGVSNFSVKHLEYLRKECQIVPSVNQVECHPYLTQTKLHAYCEKHKIQLEAWSPLMQGHIVDVRLVKKIAQKYGKTPAQVTLRWSLQNKIVTIPKSVNPDRIIENSKIFDFELTSEEMSVLDGLDKNKRFGPNPMNFNF